MQWCKINKWIINTTKLHNSNDNALVFKVQEFTEAILFIVRFKREYEKKMSAHKSEILTF